MARDLLGPGPSLAHLQHHRPGTETAAAPTTATTTHRQGWATTKSSTPRPKPRTHTTSRSPGVGNRHLTTLGEVPILKWSDPLPERPNRILVAGAPGVGKSTLAQHVAARLTLPYVELDALHHGPQWQPSPTFRDDIVALAAQHAWVTEWQYTIARPLLAERADALIFLDLPRWLVISRIIRRTLRRALQRTELWNGLREPPLRTILNDPDHIVRWTVRTHHKHAPRVWALAEHRPELSIVWLSSRRELKAWTGALAG